MKNQNTSILAIAFLGATVFGCTNAEKTTEETAAPAVEAVEFVNQEGIVQLNGTERWQANAETTAGIEKMQEQIAQFRQLQLPDDVATLNKLGGGLHNTLKGIFELCTMTGPAHEELHDFLLPINGYIKTIKGDDVNAAKQAMDDLETYLKTYADFFD